MEIRDVLHGTISLYRSELPILDSKYFQRLRHIKQMGFSEYSFPSASHTRYIHSLGAMETATRAFRSIFSSPDLERFHRLLRLAALLHDIGHGPLSHTTESAMPPVSELELSHHQGANRIATHEDYTLKIILESGLTPIIEEAGSEFGFGPKHVAALIDPSLPVEDDFFQERGVNYHPILQQLISSELDVDRMDYLRRDSLYSGVSYGSFDSDWLLTNLTYCIRNNECYLAIDHRALYTFEDFLISRYHMFLMVYFHYKGVVFDEMLLRYFKSPDCTYRLPGDVEAYVECDDAHLHADLIRSKNPWAQRITAKKPYRLLFEMHSGIPSSENALDRQLQLFDQLQELLDDRKIDYLAAQSTGELSKYFKKPQKPILVRYNNLFTDPQFIPVQECTDLFQRYKERRFIKRIYVSPSDLDECRRLGKGRGITLDAATSAGE